MKKTFIKRAIPWAAVAGWMVVIFLLSAQTSDESGNTSGEIVRWVVALLYRGFDNLSLGRQSEILEVWHTVIRKGAHFTEYAVLSVLIANALRKYPLVPYLRWLLPVVVSAAYAVTDEVHQYFVPGRACRLLDVGIDTGGAVFGVCVFAMTLSVISKMKHK